MEKNLSEKFSIVKKKVLKAKNLFHVEQPKLPILLNTWFA
tara:strand:- start:616 stop:735 length:120 start_codon:yes stop_codon:yes gene_type:complete